MKTSPSLYFTLTAIVLLASAFILNNRDEGLVVVDGIQIDTLASNLRVPWQIVFLPDQSIIFTERPGRVRIFKDGHLLVKPVFTVPDIKVETKMGLLGMCIHPQFIKNRFVYLANNYLKDDRMCLRVTRYELNEDTLIHPVVLLKDIPANRNHTGCRLLFGNDQKLYVTTGDADQPFLAQDLKTYNGKILRINDDGSIPADNPFVNNDTAKKEIWTYGHRNTQGLAIQPLTGSLFNSEHGPTGGDEINIIQKGHNYGWPLIHHQDSKSGMVSPLLEFSPSIGPSEAVFYNQKTFPELYGNLLVACLRGEGILSVKMQGDKVLSQQLLFKGKFGRIRSLVIGPDGYIYISTSNYDPPESNGTPPYDLLLRLRPSKDKSTRMAVQPISRSGKTSVQKPGAALLFQQLCASCHGTGLQGTAITKSLLNGNFKYGKDKKSILKNISNGIVAKGMPAWNGAISTADIDRLADYMLTKTR